MATLEEGLVSYLKGYSGLTALISTRVYVLTKPRTVAYPCLTFQRISTPYEHVHDTSGATGNLIHPRVQFDAWAATIASAKSITDQVRAALNGKKGPIGTSPNQVTIRSSLVDDEAAPEYEEAVRMYRIRSEYVIWLED